MLLSYGKVLNDYLVNFYKCLHLDSRFYKLEALGLLMCSLELSSSIVAKLLCSHLCLFDAIIELNAMEKKCLTTFSLESENGVCR